MAVFPSANVGSIPNANVAFVVGRSFNTLIQVSLIVANGDDGVALDDVDIIEELAAVVELISNIALSRKRVKALEDERRKAMSNLVVKMMVRG